MKKFRVIFLFMIIIIAGFWISSYGDWHLKRNRHNKLPIGNLKLVSENIYIDNKGLNWELQPHIKNTFHQPDNVPTRPGVPIPYPNISPALVYDSTHPNLKFLSDDNGASFEGILKPDGTYLITGRKQGTYNYASPEGFSGYFMHAILDVVPHLFNSNYDDALNLPHNNH